MSVLKVSLYLYLVFLYLLFYVIMLYHRHYSIILLGFDIFIFMLFTNMNRQTLKAYVRQTEVEITFYLY